MPPVYIVRIRRVEQRSLVWRQLYLFHIKISRRQQVSFPPAAWEMDFLKIGIEDVKMVTSILLGAEDNPAVPGKLQRLSRKRRQRIIHLLSAMPQLFRICRLRVRQPARPGLRALWNQRQMVLCPGNAYEDKLLAI